jgi:hypothetical protein
MLCAEKQQAPDGDDESQRGGRVLLHEDHADRSEVGLPLSVLSHRLIFIYIKILNNFPFNAPGM